MRFLLVDDERLSLRSLQRILLQLYPGVDIVCASNYIEALDHAGEKFTAVFMDIEMPEMNGLELAAKLTEYDPALNIIFSTAYDEHALEAYKLHASGYILKPYNAEMIEKEINNLRYPVEKEYLRIQCFGRFEVYCNKKPIHFERSNAKDIFAYLVYLNGASATADEISSILWESSEEVERRKSYFRTLMHSLRNTMKEYEVEDVLECDRNSYRINPDLVDCDYFHYMKGERSEKLQFKGEFMSQYSWAEDKIGILMELA